jgi:hypothetical protein
MKRFKRFLKYLAFAFGLLAFTAGAISAEVWLIANGHGRIVAATFLSFVVWAAWSVSKEAA